MKSTILLLVLYFTSSAAFCQPLTLTKIHPSSGASGDRVQLQGQGFDKSAKSYFAWGFDGKQGFVLNIKKKISKTQLSARVANDQSGAEGAVVLWEGHRKPIRKLKIANGSYEIRNGSTFVSKAAAKGPMFRLAAAGSNSRFTSRLINGELHLDLAKSKIASASFQQGKKSKPQEGTGGARVAAQSILVTCIVESCGPPDGYSSAPKLAAQFTLECLGRGPCEGDPAEILTEGLGAVLNSNGIEVRREADTVILSHRTSVCAGMVDVKSPDLTSAPAASPSRSDVIIAR